MSTVTTSRRKRARKACVPCHKRKRKCDAGYPCDMCSTYGYDCQYADTATRAVIQGEMGTTSPNDTVQSPLPSRAQEAQPVRNGLTASATIARVSDSRMASGSSPAAMAFPNILGTALGADEPPRVHPFAYNFGIRPEESSRGHGALSALISEDELTAYSKVYFAVLARIGDLIDAKVYIQRCRKYYSEGVSTAFSAVAAGIAALGSFLGSDRHPRESELVQYAKTILEDPESMRTLHVDHIIAWGLRVLYLRATTRPSNAWIASCTAMHLCEALGLNDEERIQQMAESDKDQLRRIFWINWAGHIVLSYEYDRSPVQFRAVTCGAINPRAESVAHEFVQIAQIIPMPNSPFRLEATPPTLQEELGERLKALDQLVLSDPFLIVTKADIAFCFYRRIYQLRMGVSDEFVQRITQYGNAAVDAAGRLVGQGRLFWNVIGSVFQYACVLLAIDTPAASAHVPSAFAGLQNLVKAADTPLTREAWSIAQHLLRLSMTRKRKELAQLEPWGGQPISTPLQPTELSSAQPDTAVDTWDWDWDPFLVEPYLSMFALDSYEL